MVEGLKMPFSRKRLITPALGFGGRHDHTHNLCVQAGVFLRLLAFASPSPPPYPSSPIFVLPLWQVTTRNFSHRCTSASSASSATLPIVYHTFDAASSSRQVMEHSESPLARRPASRRPRGDDIQYSEVEQSPDERLQGESSTGTGDKQYLGSPMADNKSGYAAHAIATNPSPDEVLPTRGQRRPRARDLLSWGAEAVAAFVAAGILVTITTLLATSHGKPTPDWSINLTTLVSLLTVVLRTAIGVVVIEIIGQARWAYPI
ncbi:hypothetical protein IQ07DRAFT_382687 [Pyrenochaeta sp. DS3sAY3a]|nr:hypothetical protein IQ07DRAFT_382687 [Pyrenochaeta sp. DS3sAY3a]